MSEYLPFPVKLLPKRLRRFIDEAAAALDCDPAFVALPALVACGGAIGNSRCIRLRPTWRETAILWAVVVSLSGTAKSPAMKLIEAVLHAKQKQLIEEHNRALADWTAKKDEAEAKIKEWKAAGREGERPTIPDAPTLEQIWAGDLTIEALADLLLSNWRGLSVFNHEADGWFQSFAQYKGGKGNDEAHWLQIFDGTTLKVNRKGSNGGRKFTYVPRPFVGLFGGIQPAVFRDAITHRRRKSGLAARLLVAMPDQRAMRDTGRVLSESTETEYADLMADLWGLGASELNGEPIPADVGLTPDASALWGQFVNRNADQQEAADDDQRAALAKLRTYAGRLALVIHCLRQCGGEAVEPWTCDADSLQAGIDLADWFAGEAERVYAMLDCDADPLAELVEWIKRRGGAVTVREVYNNLARYHGKPREAEDDLQALVDEGRGRWEHRGPGEAGGRPVSHFILNPANSNSGTHENQQESGGCAGAVDAGEEKASPNGRWRP